MTQPTNSSYSSVHKSAMVLLIREISDQLDEIAQLRSRGHSARIGIGMMREMCSVLRELDPELQQLYFELLPKLIGRGSRLQRRVVSDEKVIELLVPPRQRMLQKLKGDLGLKVA